MRCHLRKLPKKNLNIILDTDKTMINKMFKIDKNQVELLKGPIIIKIVLMFMIKNKVQLMITTLIYYPIQSHKFRILLIESIKTEKKYNQKGIKDHH